MLTLVFMHQSRKLFCLPGQKGFNVVNAMGIWYTQIDQSDSVGRLHMRLLFEIDKKDYGACTQIFQRDSARSIMIRNGKIAMIHSQKYDYYKFPGGGIEDGESPIEAMIRETQEEAGLIVIPETVKEYGYVHRIQKSDHNPSECFVQDNYYYLCDAVDGPVSQNLDDYEKAESYQLEYIDPASVMEKNRGVKESPYNRMMFEREARVVEMLLSEGLI